MVRVLDLLGRLAELATHPIKTSGQGREEEGSSTRQGPAWQPCPATQDVCLSSHEHSRPTAHCFFIRRGSATPADRALVSLCLVSVCPPWPADGQVGRHARKLYPRCLLRAGRASPRSVTRCLFLLLQSRPTPARKPEPEPAGGPAHPPDLRAPSPSASCVADPEPGASRPELDLLNGPALSW